MRSDSSLQSAGVGEIGVGWALPTERSVSAYAGFLVHYGGQSPPCLLLRDGE
jgi:hypothetical protein